MKTDAQHATQRQTDHTGPFGSNRARPAGRLLRHAAAAVTLMMLMTAVVAAKSMYVVAKIINFDAPIPVHVYDIGADGTLTYQTEFGAPFIGAGMVGITMDSDTGYLFSTYEDSGFILVTNATTLQRKTSCRSRVRRTWPAPYTIIRGGCSTAPSSAAKPSTS